MTTALMNRAVARPVHDDDVLEQWVVDPATARVGFAGRTRFGPQVNAWFTGVHGRVTVLADGRARVAVTVDVSTVTTGNAAWDELLRVADPFDVRRHPIAAYDGEAAAWHAHEGDVAGALTIRGRTADVPLRVSRAWASAPGMTDRARLNARATIDRTEFGIDLGLPGGSLLAPRRLSLDIDVALARR